MRIENEEWKWGMKMRNSKKEWEWGMKMRNTKKRMKNEDWEIRIRKNVKNIEN